jgi:hypothetical protein
MAIPVRIIILIIDSVHFILSLGTGTLLLSKPPSAWNLDYCETSTKYDKLNCERNTDQITGGWSSLHDKAVVLKNGIQWTLEKFTE